ncbi:MAG: adenylate/guanylate cyclase domain-containing protein [Gammaproteobacteria bacterium]|nr:adenylate/guanylate cyclase domain-containing protein [Gammaproteobacteria bacterium]
MEALVAGVAERLVAAGYPLYRLQVSARLIHPLYAATTVTWVRGQGASTDRFEHGGRQSDAWMKSPLRHMLENGVSEYHLRVGDGEGLEYPVVRELQGQGVTAYLAMRTPFGDPKGIDPDQQDGVFMTWSSSAPGGWSAPQMADLRRLQSRLAVVFRLAMRQRLAEDVVSAYLGSDAGRRILAGRIQRGDGDDIDAVIWFSDLRSSTRLAEALPKEVFLELLNRFFECTAGSVQAAGGEILGYIGDCVLAIFPFQHFGGAAPACRAALGAGRMAVARLAKVNAERQARVEAPLGFGIGLHPGTVMFGNIGLPERLNFSVIGPAANEAARVADQCRPLGEVIVVSAPFRKLAGGAGAQWRELGEFQLRNVDRPMKLFAPK